MGAIWSLLIFRCTGFTYCSKWSGETLSYLHTNIKRVDIKIGAAVELLVSEAASALRAKLKPLSAFQFQPPPNELHTTLGKQSKAKQKRKEWSEDNALATENTRNTIIDLQKLANPVPYLLVAHPTEQHLDYIRITIPVMIRLASFPWRES